MNTVIKLLCALGLGLVGNPALAQKRPEKPDLQIKFPNYSLVTQDYNFPSGLRILMQSDRSYPIVTIMSVTDKGSTDDPIGKEGIAHFVEHAWFRSKHGDLPPVMDLIRDLGCDFNATTRPDWTDWRTVCSSDKIDIMLRLESLRMTDTLANVTEDHITTEREVVRNELRGSMEQGDRSAMAYLNQHLWASDHPYARLTIGTHEALDNCHLEDIDKFTKDHYIPTNTTIMVTGDFDQDEGLSLIYKNFQLDLLHPDLTEEHLVWITKREFQEDPDNPGKNLLGGEYVEADPGNPDHFLFAAKDPDDPTKWLNVLNTPPVRMGGEAAPPPDKGGISSYGEYDAPVSARQVMIGWTLPGSFHGDDLMWNNMAQIAGGYMSFGLHEVMLDTDQDSSNHPDYGDVGCFYMEGRYNGSVVCFIELKNDKLDGQRVAEKAIDQLAPIFNPELAAQQERRAFSSRMQGLAGTMTSLDNVASVFGGRTEDIVVHAHLQGDARAHSAQMNEIMNMDFIDVQRNALKYMTRDRAVAVTLIPLPEDEILTDNSESAYHGAQRGDDVTLQEDVAKLGPERLSKESLQFDWERMSDVTLDNGLRVIVMPLGEAPVVQTTMVFGGGDLAAPHGIGSFAPNFSSSEVSNALQIGGFRGDGSWSGGRQMFVRASSGNVDGAMWMLRESIETTSPDLDFKYDWYRFQKKEVRKDWRSRGWHAWYAKQAVYGEHPLGIYDGYTELAEQNGFSFGDVKAFLDRQLQPANATLIVVGPVDVDKTNASAKQFFDNWKADSGVEVGPMPKLPPPTPGGEPSILVYDAPKNTQTVVQMACPLNTTSVELEPARRVVTKMLSDDNFLTLRVTHGVTYGAYAGGSGDPSGVATLSMQSQSQNTGAALTAQVFLDLASEAEAGNFDKNKINQAKLRIIRQLGLSEQSAAGMSNSIVEAILWEQDPKDLGKRAQAIASVTEDQMKQVMQGCTEHAIITMQGPLSFLEGHLDENKVEYEIVDWRAKGDDLLAQYDPKRWKKVLKDRAKADKKKAKEEAEAGDSEETGAGTN